MNIHSYFPPKSHKKIISALSKGNIALVTGIGIPPAKCYLLAEISKHIALRNIFWISADDKVVYDNFNNLPFWLNEPVELLDHLEGAQRDYRPVKTVFDLHSGGGRAYLLSVVSLTAQVPLFSQISEGGAVIRSGQELRVVAFFNQLLKMGYEPSSDIMLKKGECRRSGGVINVFPVNRNHPIKVEVDYDTVAGIWEYNQEKKTLGQKLEEVDFIPIHIENPQGTLLECIQPGDLVVADDLEDDQKRFLGKLPAGVKLLDFATFPKNEEDWVNMRYLSVLKYYNIFDLINDLKDKLQREWRVVILSKRIRELKVIFEEENMRYSLDPDEAAKLFLIDAGDLDHIPSSFQNPELKLQLLTDKEIFNLSKSSSKAAQQVSLDFLTGLKIGDLVVHMDHGIGRFLGVVQKQIDEIQREYLEIGYAENDRLFIPIDQADKISKYVGGEENEPKLTRLGSVEWRNVRQKIKKETQKIAKELLELYAKRAQAKGHNYGPDTPEQRKFEESFPYEETPGQMKAIADVKKDMESDQPMDRLICGDVGFGKTEVAMRAAFKAVQGGKQVAFISPITILADQHYQSFKKRAQGHPVRIEMLSRFRTPAQQQQILRKLRKGEIDVLIGTHRLLQPDVQFFNLGLVIIDEEQRFGVKQKERFKSIRNQVDILTLTATPIPRTLNLAMNKLRDISTITTPPPGRLPVVTEVRRYSDRLVVEAIQKEVDRQGQVYFLHNRVKTIESIALKLRRLMPHIRFVVAHGQLSPAELEQRIMKFKNKEYDVLVSSTIVENGIDLPSANTLLVDDAEHFGLSQMYQLRGRIGRSKIQAYAFFLYQSKQLRLDAKKRLKAIVDASELGSGFQVALRDLEIRGAGDILGMNQHGTVKVVGVNYFLRMLNKTIEEMKSGRQSDEAVRMQDVSIELPLSAYIPDSYIPDTKEKISVYQKLSSVEEELVLEELRADLIDQYGHLPKEVSALFKVLEIKIAAKMAGLLNVKSITKGQKGREVILHMSEKVVAEQIMNLLKHNPKWLISGDKLKIDLKELGFNWADKLRENVKLMILG